jgi:hypothetical protein
MAVIDSILGISVVVCVDEQALAEYDDDNFNADRESNMISKYVQSDILKEFAVRLTIEPPYTMNSPTLGFQIYVDGIKVREPLLRKAVLSRGGGHWESSFNGIKYSTGGQQPDCILRPFKFSEIQTCESYPHLLAIRSSELTAQLPTTRDLTHCTVIFKLWARSVRSLSRFFGVPRRNPLG